MMSKLRQRNTVAVYAFSGGFGALAGVGLGLLALLIGKFGLGDTRLFATSNSFASVIRVSFLAAIFACTLSTALALARQSHQGTSDRRSVVKAGTLGLLAGASTGGIAQTLYNGVTDAHDSISAWVAAGTWIMLGALLGSVLSPHGQTSRRLPGLFAGLATGSAAGLLAGAAVWVARANVVAVCILGSIGFGLLLGLALVVLARQFPGATIEVQWSPKETTEFSLGVDAITVGGGDDDIYLAGASPQISSIFMKDGRIEHIEHANGKRTTLKDGSRLRIGGLVMVVHEHR